MDRKKNIVSWKIGGQAGFGVQSSGELFAQTCVRAGLFAFDYSEYPSVIRGAHTSYQVNISAQPIAAWRGTVDVLVALDLETIQVHLPEVGPGGAVIFDSHHPALRGFQPAQLGRSDIHWHGLPLGQMALDHQAELLMRNVVAVGTSFALLSLEFEFPKRVVQELFERKGAQVAQMNVQLLEAGYRAVSKEAADHFPWDLDPVSGAPRRMFITGNEAIGLGAIQAGCKFYAAYPMTPSSTLLHYLAAEGPKAGMLVRHAEDEIGVINETIGAAYAGVRAMCGTAGGGFALMTEAVGLAGMTEVGVVIVEVQRGGPSTGLATWTEQADLRQVLHASQGDFLKVVLAPGDVQECFELTQLAFNLAERFQTPVLLMSDKYLAESRATTETLTTALRHDRGLIESKPSPRREFQRYQPNPANGVSARTLPGTPHGLFVANSDEHNSFGYSDESADGRLQQMDKRARKIEAVRQALPEPKLIGPARADLSVIGWGSTKGIIQAAITELKRKHGVTANHLHLWKINPFPAQAVQEILRSAQVSVMVEGNQSGQLAGWLRQQTGLEPDHHIRQYDGRPFEPTHLTKQLHSLVRV